mgnify:CR=1 FL=1
MKRPRPSFRRTDDWLTSGRSASRLHLFRKFDLEFPKQQLIEKTDLAKYLNVWECHPDVVSKGAQKNFAQYALRDLLLKCLRIQVK